MRHAPHLAALQGIPQGAFAGKDAPWPVKVSFENKIAALWAGKIVAIASGDTTCGCLYLHYHHHLLLHLLQLPDEHSHLPRTSHARSSNSEDVTVAAATLSSMRSPTLLCSDLTHLQPYLHAGSVTACDV